MSKTQRARNPCAVGVRTAGDSKLRHCMKVVVCKTNAMVLKSGESTTECDVLIEGEKVEQGKEFAYSGSLFTNDERLSIHNGAIIPMLMYGSESWAWQEENESRINAVEMRSLRSMCGVCRKGRCRNSNVRELCDLKDVVTRVKRGMSDNELLILLVQVSKKKAWSILRAIKRQLLDPCQVEADV
ncbi:hypothetical protein EVAR_37605_1 [Eumeta japonica]|uniref:Uncharacterized protein n=1 Tax=Eumeta variegata TaxID=151549 RepID=A0A4C1VQU0_EUMVA|nr:hypothetical protein EVAR_37605_1 [Eumeta japonica]